MIAVFKRSLLLVNVVITCLISERVKGVKSMSIFGIVSFRCFMSSSLVRSLVSTGVETTVVPPSCASISMEWV